MEETTATTAQTEASRNTGKSFDLSDEKNIAPGDPTILKLMSTFSDSKLPVPKTIDSPTKIQGGGGAVASEQHKPILDRFDIGQQSLRAGTLKVHIESTTVLFGKVRNVRERYVHVDEIQGIFIAMNRDFLEKGDKKHCAHIPFSEVAGVLLKPAEHDEVVTGCRFVIYLKNISSTFGTQIEFETPASKDAEEWVFELRKKILVKARVYTVGLNGEFPENLRGVRPNVALCFSGGGGRAHVCASAQLRVLHHLKLLKKSKIDYLSAVSGGAWAATIFTFYERGATNDDELLGSLSSLDLKKWTLDMLDNEPLCPILAPTKVNAMTIATEMLWNTNPHQLWEKVMGKIFLKPFGLNKDNPYCLREDVEAIKTENPALANNRFNVTRTVDRPFFMCHGTIIGPDWAKTGSLLPIQFSPLYTGSPYLHRMKYEDKSDPSHSESIWIGGGMVDTFAFGGDEPASAIAKADYWGDRSSFSLKSVFGSFSRMSTSLKGERLKLNQSHRKTHVKSPKHDDIDEKKLVMKSSQFHNLVSDTIEEKLKTPLPFSEEINDAIQSLNLAPHMIQRVFRHAQDALRQDTYIRNSTKERAFSDTKDNDGVVVREVALPSPEIAFCLRHTLGISSDAPGLNFHEKSLFNKLNIHEKYWTPVITNDDHLNKKHEMNAGDLNVSQKMTTTHARVLDMGDGFSLDNLGICAMLQRHVRKIIVFCNTSNTVPFPGHNGQQRGSMKRISKRGSVVASARRESSAEQFVREQKEVDITAPPEYTEWYDEDVLPLFGQKMDDERLNPRGIHHQDNHVFPLSDLRPLLNKFQEKLIQGEPLVVRMKHQVLDNSLWGIEGGWEVDIMWIYLEDSAIFRSKLPDETILELDKPVGELARFPNFKIFGNRHMFDISLFPRQINLLNVYAEWTLLRVETQIKEFIEEELPELVRVRPDKFGNAVDALHNAGFV